MSKHYPEIDEDFESLNDDMTTERSEEEWNEFCKKWAEDIKKLQEVKDETSTV